MKDEEIPTPSSVSFSNLSQPNPTGKRLRASRRISIVWNHFTTINRQNTKGEVENLAKYKYCKKTNNCKASGGISHLRRHVKQCTQKYGALVHSQTKIRSSTSSMSPFIYNQEFMREGLAGIVASVSLPLTFGEDLRVVHFMQKYVQPTFHRIPRTTSSNDVIKCYKNEKQLIIKEFNNHSGIVFVTSDIWTNHCNDTFTCVTTHYTNSNWKLNNKILGFREIFHPHDEPAISNSLKSVFKEYDVQRKFFSITFNNASNNKSVINLFIRTIREGPLSEIFHVRCVCHIINLIVQDGLKLISLSLGAIQSTLRFLDSSSELQEFYALYKSIGLKKRKFHRDVVHRWNSTYVMLKSCRIS